MKRKFESELQRSIHEDVAELEAAGLADKATMRRFNEAGLTPVEPLSPEDIREIRKRENVSQAVLAAYLNVSVRSIVQWERGERKPEGSILKMLALVKAKGLRHIA